VKFPFVSRETYEDALRSKQNEIDELRGTLYRLEDRFYLEGFGFQLHGTIPDAPSKPVAEPATPAPEADPVEEEREENIRRLISLRKTSPSRLGPELARIMQADLVRGVSSRPSAQVFAAAKQEALSR
jgi:hypothetical protein